MFEILGQMARAVAAIAFDEARRLLPETYHPRLYQAQASINAATGRRGMEAWPDVWCDAPPIATAQEHAVLVSLGRALVMLMDATSARATEAGIEADGLMIVEGIAGAMAAISPLLDTWTGAIAGSS